MPPIKNQRPGAVTAVAILNFVFGGFGLLGLLCGGLVVLLVASVIQNAPPPPGGGPNPLTAMKDLYASIPGFIPYMIGSSLLGALMSLLLIISGFGLLQMRNWARIACFVYAGVTILSTIGGAVYNLTVVQPATEKWAADFQAKLQAQAGGPGVPAPPPSNPVANAAGAVVGSVVGIAYAVLLLVLLNLPSVRAAFARAARGEGAADGDEEDDRDWDEDRPERPRYRSREGDDRIMPSDG